VPIIFGIKRRAYRLATVFALCGLCQTPAAQAVTRVRTFFSLFFIPVIPLSSTYRTTCTMCGGSVKVTKEAAERLVASAPPPGVAPAADTAGGSVSERPPPSPPPPTPIPDSLA
jgi:hypothetical protein